MRRQIALAQAAVSRIRQLSVRVGRILDPKRSGSTQSWKPAVPGVILLAVISGISVSGTPDLVRVGSGTKVVAGTTGSAIESSVPIASSSNQAATRAPEVRAWPAGMKSSSIPEAEPKSLYVPARHVPAKRAIPAPGATQAKTKHVEHSPVILAGYTQPNPKNALADQQARNFVLVIETRQTVVAGADGLHVSVQQLRWLVPVNQVQKSVPSKT
jgi:hypothetical protein